MRRISEIVKGIQGRVGVLLLSFLSLLLTPSFATTITWEDRGGEAIRLAAMMGTPLATYTEKSGDLRLSEQHLYGAKRLGMRSSNLLVATTNSQNGEQEDNSAEKRYELTNHFGNVLAVVSDQKKEDGSAQILSLTDYYPFGMEMDGRKYEKDGGYRYGFTGHEKEFDMANDVYTTDFRLLDARVGRWLSVDPLADKYAGMSPYNYCGGNPVFFVDKKGKEIHVPREYQAKVMEILESVFGENCGFSFEGEKMMYSGKIEALSKEDRKIMSPFLAVVETDEYVVDVHLKKDDKTDKNGGAYSARNTKGSKLVKEGSSIVIDPDAKFLAINIDEEKVYVAEQGGTTTDYNKAKIDHRDMSKVIDHTIKTERYIEANITTAFFHEIGHFYFGGKKKQNVIEYENRVRKKLKMEERQVDKDHMGKEKITKKKEENITQ